MTTNDKPDGIHIPGELTDGELTQVTGGSYA